MANDVILTRATPKQEWIKNDLKYGLFNIDSNNNLVINSYSGSYTTFLTGSVGIGTDTPTSKLHIASSDTTIVTINGTNTRGWILFSEQGVGRGYIGYGDSGNIFDGACSNSLSLRSEHALHLGGNGNCLTMTLISGSVGIGTTSPAYALDVNGNAVIGDADSNSVFLGNVDNAGLERIRIGSEAATDGVIRIYRSTGRFLISGDNTDDGGQISLYGRNHVTYPQALTLETNNTIRVFVSGSGNIGMGTTSPSQKLQINGNIRVTGSYYDSNNSAGSSGQILSSTATGTDWLNLIDISGAITGSGTTNYLAKWTPNGNSLGSSVIYDNGAAVGIGTTSPSRILELRGANPILRLRSTASGSAAYAWMEFYESTGTGLGFVGYGSNTSNNLYLYNCTNDGVVGIYTDTTLRINVLSQGDVGIGEITPTQKLHVDGNIRVSGSYYDSNNSKGTSGQILSSTTTGTDWLNLIDISGAITGSGTTNYISLWNSSNSLSSSNIYQDSNGNIGINCTSPAQKLDVCGNIKLSGELIIGNFDSRILPLGSTAIRFENDQVTLGEMYRISTVAGSLRMAQFSTGATADSYPAYTFTTDSDTGLYLHNTDEVGLTTGGVGRLIINSSGSVGIGTTIPSQKLQINGSIRVTGSYYDSNNSAGSSGQILSSTGTGTDWTNLIDISGAITGSGTTNYISLWNSSNSLSSSGIYQDSNGNIGIGGTTSPTEKLSVILGDISLTTGYGIHSVNGGNENGIFFSAGTASSTSNFVRLFTDGSERFRVDYSGNVGIGTTSPDGRLHVWTGTAGSVAASSVADEAVFEGSGDTGISILAPDNKEANLFFGSPSLSYGGIVRWKFSDSQMTIGTSVAGSNVKFISGGGTTAMVIDSSQKVGIGISGTTSPEKLTINGNISASGDLYLDGALYDINNSAGSSGQILSSTGTGVDWLNLIDISGAITGSGTQNYLPIWNTSNSLSSSIIYQDSNGNIGIGTTSPSADLHVEDTVDGDVQVRIRNLSTGTSARSGLRIEDASSVGGNILVNHTNYTGVSAWANAMVISGDAALNNGIFIFDSDIIRLGNTTSGDLYISSSCVGVGIESPLTPLHVYNYTTDSSGAGRTTSLDVLTIESENTAAQEYGGFGQNIVFNGSTYNLTTQRPLGRISHRINDSSVNTTRGTSFLFQTLDDPSSSDDPTTKLIIDYTSFVGIGTTSPSQKLHITGNIRVTGSYYDSNNSAGSSGQILSSTATGTDWLNLIDITGAITGSGTTGYLPIWSTSSKLGNSVVYQSNGNIGIGTTIPDSMLEITDPTNGDAFPLHLTSTDGGWSVDQKLGLYFKQLDSVLGQMYTRYANGDWGIGFKGYNSGVTDELFTIYGNGNVGIGITAPNEQLEIAGNFRLPATTSTTGIIYRDGNTFIHNFQHPTGDTAVPTGRNTFVGQNAGNLTLGSTAVAVGQGSFNNGFGFQTLLNLTTGYSNNAVGHRAGVCLTSGFGNVLFGDSAGYNINTGLRNTLIGYAAGFNITASNYNVAIGHNALVTDDSGIGNTIVGSFAADVTVGSDYLVVMGYQAMSNMTSGSYNVALGYRAGLTNTDSNDLISTDYGVFIGPNVVPTEGSTNEIIIGKDTNGNGSNTVTIGNDSITKTILNGNIGIGTTSPVSKLEIVSNTESTTQTDLTQAFSSAGIIINTEYTTNAYTPGLFWRTSNNNPTKPKAGIYLLENGSGTTLYFGTSNNYGTGITNDAIVINPSGNIGVNTTSPAQKLHINGNILLENNTEIRQKDSGGTERTIIELDSSNDLNIGGSYAGALKFIGGGSYSEVARFDDNGNLGIGTTAPEDILDIVGKLRISDTKSATTNKTNRIRGEHYDITEEPVTFMFMNAFSTTNQLFIGGGSSLENAVTSIGFYTGATNTTTTGTTRMYIASDGNVGIGTTSPTENLHVASCMVIDGNLGIGASPTGGHKIYINGEVRADITTTTAGGSGGKTWQTWGLIDVGGVSYYIALYQ